MRGMFALGLAVAGFAGIVAADDDEYTVWATPHDSYSSSIGVLGCKVDTNRIAYWPGSVDCDNLCVRLSYGDRSVKLLRIDQSGGAYDVSYDAWNYLQTGSSASEEPIAGGTVEMTAEDLDADECEDLIWTKGSKLPLSAANSMNFLASCLERETWVGQNYVLYNVLDPICTLGRDETCDLDWPAANMPSCPNMLGDMAALKDLPVVNIMYPSGQEVVAGTGAAAPEEDGAGSMVRPGVMMIWAVAFVVVGWVI